MSRAERRMRLARGLLRKPEMPSAQVTAAVEAMPAERRAGFIECLNWVEAYELAEGGRA